MPICLELIQAKNIKLVLGGYVFVSTDLPAVRIPVILLLLNTTTSLLLTAAYYYAENRLALCCRI